MAVLVHILGDGAGVSAAVVLYPSEAGNPYAWLTIDDGFRSGCRIMFFRWLRIVCTHDAYLLIYIAFAIGSGITHLSNFAAGELIAGTADRCSLGADEDVDTGSGVPIASGSSMASSGGDDACFFSAVDSTVSAGPGDCVSAEKMICSGSSCVAAKSALIVVFPV